MDIYLYVYIYMYIYEHTMHRQVVQKVKRFTDQLTKTGQRGKTRGQHTGCISLTWHPLHTPLVM